MKLTNVLICLFGILCCPLVILAQENLPAPENQIKAAVSPAPEDLQEGAKFWDIIRKGNWYCFEKVQTR